MGTWYTVHEQGRRELKIYLNQHIPMCSLLRNKTSEGTEKNANNVRN